ncbi:MAG: hypothetical protein JWR41_1498 [Modestobacter sp.]|nr:hypothetical protein [Modestobacter sp.]
MSAPASSARTWEAEDYLAAVGHELADLPADERSALLEDLASHLGSLAAEDDDRPLVIRLGSPSAYAEELRSAAGLPPRATARTEGRLARLRGEAARVAAHPLGAELSRFLVELRPGWWVLRGYLVVAVPCLAAGEWDFPVPRPLGSPALGLLVVVVAVVASVALGRRRLPRPATVLVNAAGALLALAACVMVAERSYVVHDGDGYAEAAVYDRAVGEYPLVSRYGPVTDVLPYAADGTPLTGVLLFDQDGRPLHVGRQEWWADDCVRVLQQPLAADGVPVSFSYPQAYVLDPTGLDRFGAPVSAGQCRAELPRPQVPLPVFPAPTAGG